MLLFAQKLNDFENRFSEIPQLMPKIKWFPKIIFTRDLNIFDVYGLNEYWKILISRFCLYLILLYLILFQLTYYAEGKFAQSTKFANQWRMFISAIINRQPIVGTVFIARANVPNGTGHDIFTSATRNRIKIKTNVKSKRKRCNISTI